MRFHLQYEGEEEVHDLREGSTLVGKDGRVCRICIHAPGVKPVHFKCFYDPAQGKVHITGLQGRFRVNGKKNKKCDLYPYDVVTFGAVRLTLLPGQDDSGTSTAGEPGESGTGISFDEAEDYGAEEPATTGRDIVHIADPGHELTTPEAGRATQLFAHQGHWYLQDVQTEKVVEIIFLSETPPPLADPSGYPRPVLLLKRDEEWFLRDYATEREFPITRLGPVDVAMPDSYPRGTRPVTRVNRVLLFIVPLAIACVLVFAYALFAPPKTTQQNDLWPKYEALLEKGFLAMDSRDYAKAKECFAKARNMIPSSLLARDLVAAAEIESKRGEKFSDYPWSAAADLYEKLQESTEASPAIRAFARKRVEMIRKYTMNQRALEVADDFLRKGLVFDALKEVESIHEDDLVYIHHRDWFASLKKEGVRAYMQKAAQARDEMIWAKALNYAEKAQAIKPSREIMQFMKDCIAAQNVEIAIHKAQNLVAEAQTQADLQTLRRKLEQAKDLLIGKNGRPIYVDSPYEGKGKALAQEISRRLFALRTEAQAQQIVKLFYARRGDEALQALQRLKSGASSIPLDLSDSIEEAAITYVGFLYDSGRADEAIKFIQKGKACFSDKVGAIEAQLEKSLETFSRARQLDKTGRYSAAREAWTKLLEHVNKKGNFYYQEAEKRVKWYKEKGSLLANELYEKAIPLKVSDPGRARELLLEAKKWDPENANVKKKLAELRRDALVQLNLGVTFHNQAPEKARIHYMKAIEMAGENSEIGAKAKLRLRDLK